MLPENYIQIITKNGIERGIYHNGQKNIFCVVKDNEIVLESHDPFYTIAKFDALQERIKEANTVNSKAEEDEYNYITQYLGGSNG